MAATLLGLTHTRSVLSKQCLQSLLEVATLTESNSTNDNAQADSDVESRNEGGANDDDEADESGSCSESGRPDNAIDSAMNSSDEDEPGPSVRGSVANGLKKRKWGTLKKPVLNKTAGYDHLKPAGRKFAKRSVGSRNM